MIELVLIMVRAMLITFGNIWIMAIIMEHMLVRRHSFKVLILWAVLKTVFINEVFMVLLQKQMQTYVYVQNTYLVLSSIAAIMTYFVFIYTYAGEPIKIMIVATISEVIEVVIGSVLIMIVNICGGRAIGAFREKLQVSDLLFPVLIVIIMPLICKILEPFFKRVRKLQIKHKRICIFLMMLYILVAIHTTFGAYQQGVLEMYFLLGCALACIVFGYAQLYHRKEKWKNEYLKKQQRLAKMQYSAITLQIEKMEQAQKEINEQMQKILSMPEDEKTELTESYIKGLKRKSDAITQGMYCDSWLLDSVLCHQMMVCKERNVEADFRLHGYQKGIVREEDLAELVHYLLEKYLEDETVNQIFLKIASMKGQLVLQLQGNGKTAGISKRKIKKYTKDYGVIFEQKKDIDMIEVKLVMSYRKM